MIGTSASSSPTSARISRVFAWPRFAQQNNVLARDNGVFDLRQNRILIADDPREKFLPGTDAPHEVLAKLVLHIQDGVLALPQFSNRPRLGS